MNLMKQALIRRRYSVNPQTAELKTRFTKLALERLDDDTLNNDAIAIMLGLSRSLFYKKIKEATGITPNEYLKNIRLNEAAKMLQEKDASVSEVTVRVGFNDPRYFRNCFKKVFGKNPSEFWKAPELKPADRKQENCHPP